MTTCDGQPVEHQRAETVACFELGPVSGQDRSAKKAPVLDQDTGKAAWQVQALECHSSSRFGPSAFLVRCVQENCTSQSDAL